MPAGLCWLLRAGCDAGTPGWLFLGHSQACLVRGDGVGGKWSPKHISSSISLLSYCAIWCCQGKWVQLLGESVWEQLMMTPGLLTQRGIEVGMAEPPGVQLLLLLQVQQAHSSVGSAKQSLDSLAGVENLSC